MYTYCIMIYIYIYKLDSTFPFKYISLFIHICLIHDGKRDISPWRSVTWRHLVARADNSTVFCTKKTRLCKKYFLYKVLPVGHRLAFLSEISSLFSDGCFSIT